MGRCSKIAHDFWARLVEGGAIRGTCKQISKLVIKYWKKAWKQADRALGVLAREILKRKTPIVKNKVLFHTQENRYGCNQKYICEELLRRKSDIDIVWRVSTKNRGGVPQTVRAVKAGSFAYYKEMFSANIVITNSVLFVDQAIYLKKNQTLIETWHGSLGIKRFGRKDYKNGWRWVRGAIVTGKKTNYCITNSRFVSESLRNTYWPKTPMLEYGHPRNDLFFDNYKEQRAALRTQLCEKWGVSPDCKFVMYGPTFRDSQGFSCYDIDFDRLIENLKCRFGGEWVLLLRYHPSLAKVYRARGGIKVSGAYPVKNVTEYLDMQELISITDIGITDYSSWIYDFMLLRRPGFIYAPDIEFYNNERGFCYPLETTPFPIAVNNDELEDRILNFNETDYLRRLELFLEEKGCIEDGHASERVADLVEGIIRGQGAQRNN